MTVKELIAMLETMPKNAKIVTTTYIMTTEIDRHDGMPIYQQYERNVQEVEKIDKKTVKIY